MGPQSPGRRTPLYKNNISALFRFKGLDSQLDGRRHVGKSEVSIRVLESHSQHEMEAGRDRLLRRFTILATSVTAVIVLTADYGPQPHALSAVSRWWDAGKDWLLSPTEKELAELEKRRKVHLVRKESEDKGGDKS